VIGSQVEPNGGHHGALNVNTIEFRQKRKKQGLSSFTKLKRQLIESVNKSLRQKSYRRSVH
jgi:hypothetical protein